MKKTFVLVVLFILPLVAYLFFASGINNFGKLPVLTAQVADISEINPEFTFADKITILGFLGNKPEIKKGNVFNLNQKIYKPFYEFNDFQVIMLAAQGTEDKVQIIEEELSGFTDTRNYHFVFASEAQIRSLFTSLETSLSLDEDLGSKYVFIIDKDKQLRGRDQDEDEGMKYGFDATSVADLNNKMEDDVKIILAEYRLALKKNTAKREN
ncbi:MAG: hypothetical protein OER83_00275 [Flavobacteriaceae bacterium]|nr:hypothetical protein [Flavobacteriaceae bacterium]MDH3795283.1 hypothetical protein [Flavobacteriaceae bacterium]